jgi:hypothetical protein
MEYVRNRRTPVDCGEGPAVKPEEDLESDTVDGGAGEFGKQQKWKVFKVPMNPRQIDSDATHETTPACLIPHATVKRIPHGPFPINLDPAKHVQVHTH